MTTVCNVVFLLADLSLRSPEPCTARGTGLVTGVVGKRCKFNIFLLSKDNLDLVIEVKGPQEGEKCVERVEYYSRGEFVG